MKYIHSVFIAIGLLCGWSNVIANSSVGGIYISVVQPDRSEIPQEAAELLETKIDYLTRIKDALMEYKQSLDETYMKEVDFFSAFNKNALDKNVNLMENLFSNISGYYTYGSMLTELSRRVPALAESTQLVKMLADAGVDAVHIDIMDGHFLR